MTKKKAGMLREGFILIFGGNKRQHSKGTLPRSAQEHPADGAQWF